MKSVVKRQGCRAFSMRAHSFPEFVGKLANLEATLNWLHWPCDAVVHALVKSDRIHSNSQQGAVQESLNEFQKQSTSIHIIFWSGSAKRCKKILNSQIIKHTGIPSAWSVADVRTLSCQISWKDISVNTTTDSRGKVLQIKPNQTSCLKLFSFSPTVCMIMYGCMANLKQKNETCKNRCYVLICSLGKWEC